MSKRSQRSEYDRFVSLGADERERAALRKIARIQKAQDEDDAVIGRLLRCLVWIGIALILGILRVFH